MRLLNTRTFKLAEFYTDIPTYAILSHTWGEEEVAFQDIQNLDAAKNKRGWHKVESACTYASRYNFEWIWIDSCCIDKSSSAELSEAINSMYQYYEDCHVCYAYLCEASNEEDPRNVDSGFRKSKWFERGWTLQELLAPRFVVILDKDWKEIGTRWSLRDAISAITSIPVQVLEDGDTRGYSIAQKMSWAALRKTTRPEDIAYCLMGIFGVNMPPLYGEGGPKAFMRLQQEIIKYSDDRSIFAWIADTVSQISLEFRGLLARSPYEFRISGEVSVSQSELIGDKSSFSFGNNGLHIHFPLSPAPNLGNDIFLASLYCRTQDDRHIGLCLQKTNGQYVRVFPDQLPFIDEPPLKSPSILQEIVVKETHTIPYRNEQQKHHVRTIKFHVRRLSPYIICVKTYLRDWYHTGDIIHHGTADIQVSIGPTRDSASLALEYKSEAGEQYIIAFDVKPGPLPETLMHIGQTKRFQVGSESYPPDRITLGLGKSSYRKDRALSSLKETSTGLLSCAIQMTGDPLENILEIDYIPKNNLETFRTKIPAPAIGFTVETGVAYLAYNIFSLHEVFPPDFSSRSDRNENCYTSVSDEQQSRWRVLAYKRTSHRQDGIVYIVLGLHESGMPWIDAILSSSKQFQTEDIWKSYLDSGPRAKIRRSCQKLALVTLNDVLCMTATLEKRATLQLGGYTLRRTIHARRRHSAPDT